MNKGSSLPITLVAVAIVSLLIFGAYYLGQKSTNTNIVNNSDTGESKNEIMSNSSPVASPIINDIDSWLTFSEPAYGFSIKYPSDWTITDRMSEDRAGVKVSKFFNFENRGYIKDGNWAHFTLDTTIDEAKISEWNNTKYATTSSKAQIESSDFQGRKLYRVTSVHYQITDGVEKEVYTLYKIYIPTKDGYIQLASNLNMKDTLEKMLTTFQVANK